MVTKARKTAPKLEKLTSKVNVWTQSKAELELQRWADYYLARLGTEKIALVVRLTHQPKHLQKLCGYFEYGKNYTHKPSGTKANTLAICEEFLDRSIRDIVGTFAHEISHMDCFTNGIKDTSNGGRHHNKHFKANGETRLGLAFGERNGTHGYNLTSLTDMEWEILQVELKPDETAFNLVRTRHIPKVSTGKKYARYECQCEKPKKILCAVGVDLSANCNDCQEDFLKVD